MNKAFKRAKRENKIGKKMFNYIYEAEKKYEEIDKNSNKYYLLHGDLHHWNILKDRDKWKAIDPKGVIGPAIME